MIAMRHIASAAVAAGLACLFSCGASEAPPPNLILVSIDTLRADHLQSYGYERPTSPALDRLARQGALFETAVANSPWTLPSHASMLTGLVPGRHGLTDYGGRLRSETPSLASTLREAGYATLALVNSHSLSRRFGLERGFEEHHYFEESLGRQRVRSASRQIDRLLAWLEKRPNRPFFVFLHNYDVHADYDPSAEFAAMFTGPYKGSATGTARDLVRKNPRKLGPADVQHLIDLYDGGIRQLDAQIARLLEYLDAAELADNTYVVVTSDHGEEFREHGGVLHAYTYYEEVLWVPMMIRGPGVPAGARIPGLVQLTDIFPTLLELAGVAIPEGIDGVSLAKTWGGSGVSPQRRAFAEASKSRRKGRVMRMVREGSLKLIYEQKREIAELYDLAVDPEERSDISRRRPDTVRRLLTVLEQYAADTVPADPILPLSAEEIENLRSLGYLD